MGSLQLARDVYGRNPEEPVRSRSSLPVIRKREVRTTVESVALYAKTDHWVGMRSGLTDCLCSCHIVSGEGEGCSELPGRPDPNWCNASPRS